MWEFKEPVLDFLFQDFVYFIPQSPGHMNPYLSTGSRPPCEVCSGAKSTEVISRRPADPVQAPGQLIRLHLIGGPVAFRNFRYALHFAALLGHEKGIGLLITTPHTSSSNGRPERADRTLMEKGRAGLIDTGLPMDLWPSAVESAVLVANLLFAAGPDEAALIQLASDLGTFYPIRNFGNAQFLATDIDRDRDQRIIYLSQKTYVRNLLARFGFGNLNGAPTLWISGMVLPTDWTVGTTD
ncbi:Ribonuclease H-like protein [Niveomyces insectorum RCEF 264]|uniref:Ribonuclease H-like protein n=1 Tax=Niveomyces insectorum RCEF 264 TaxID=1081102 RepID=A0A167W281_9HYPO|nr:Ribonuclease H-like protein [Niveomyces insectorum RCEF 264]